MAIVKPREEKEIQVGKPSLAWMLTYADMMSLLLCFFILLFSLSNVNLLKFSSYFKKMKASPVFLDEEQLKRVMLEIAEYAENKGLAEAIRMEITEQGLVINLNEKLMFHSGSADLLPEAFPVLDEIFIQLKKVPNEIILEGHTDNVPIHTLEFASNWELSTSRASNVVRYFVENKGFSPFKISASGYGEYRPIGDNLSVDGRALNRRIVLIILRQKIK